MKTHVAKHNKACYYIYTIQLLIKNVGVHLKIKDMLDHISNKLPDGSPVMSYRQMQRVLSYMKSIGLVDNQQNYGWYITEEGLKGFGYDKYGDIL